MDTYEGLELVGYLYNICYRGFSFSEKFMELLNQRRAEKGLERVKYMDDPNDRVDPMAVELFQEMGSEESSGYGSKIKLKWFPNEFVKFIDMKENEGRESVRLSRDNIYADLLHTFIEKSDKDVSLTLTELKMQYAAINDKLVKYDKYMSTTRFK